MYGAKFIVQFAFQNAEDQDAETVVLWKAKPFTV